MSRRKSHSVIPNPETPPSQYWEGERVSCVLHPLYGSAALPIEGEVACTPDRSPFACYHVKTDGGDEWFVIESEIVGKVEPERRSA